MPDDAATDVEESLSRIRYGEGRFTKGASHAVQWFKIEATHLIRKGVSGEDLVEELSILAEAVSDWDMGHTPSGKNPWQWTADEMEAYRKQLREEEGE